MKGGLFFSLLLSFSVSLFSQTLNDYRTTANGNWNNIATWQRWNGSAWVAATEYPGSSAAVNSVSIMNGNSVTLNQSISNNIASLYISPGGGGTNTQLTFGGSYSLSVAGSIVLSPGTTGNHDKIIVLNTGASLSCTSVQMGTSGNNNRTAFININGGTMSVSGDIAMQSTGLRNHIATGINGTLAMSGSFVGTAGSMGKFDGTGGKLVFISSENQTLPASGSEFIYYNVSLLKSSGSVQLDGDVSINGTLQLVAGKINTSTHLLTLSNSNTANQLTGGSANAYVYSNGTGRLRRNGVTSFTPDLIFPIGTVNYFMPVEISDVGGSTSDFAVSVFEGATTNGVDDGDPFSDKSEIVDAIWNIEQPAGTVLPATVKISWVNNLEGSSFSSFNDNQIGISHYSGSGWDLAIATMASQVNNFVKASFTQFSPFGIGKFGVPLPVKFGSFKAHEKQKGIQLNWKVYAEDRIRNYNVERSIDAVNYTKIGTLPALQSAGGDYSFFDADPLQGSSYYRIRTDDADGRSSYSIVVKVNYEKTFKALKFYPNPVTNGVLTLQGSELAKGIYKILLFNRDGQLLKTLDLNHPGGAISQAINLTLKIPRGLITVALKDDLGNLILSERINVK